MLSTPRRRSGWRPKSEKSLKSSQSFRGSAHPRQEPALAPLARIPAGNEEERGLAGEAAAQRLGTSRVTFNFCAHRGRAIRRLSHLGRFAKPAGSGSAVPKGRTAEAEGEFPPA